MRRTGWATGGLALVAFLGLTAESCDPSPDARCDQATVTKLTNEARAKNDVPPVKVDADLEQAAQAHTKSMVDRNSMDHQDWVEEIQAAGYDGQALGQNVARGPDAQTVVDAWMGSEGHRENILNAVYDDVGIGCVDADGTLWWTQNLGAKQ